MTDLFLLQNELAGCLSLEKELRLTKQEAYDLKNSIMGKMISAGMRESKSRITKLDEESRETGLY